jgi:hypothetical protein
MYTTIRGCIAVAALAAAAACSDAGAPTEPSFLTPPEAAQAKAPSRLTFSSTQSYETQTPQTATGGVGTIDFTGSLTTGTPCYDVSAAHRSGPGQVTVTVSAVSTGGICAQVITHNNYQGRVSNLAPGTYTFTVIHEVNGSRTTAYTSTVVVQ